MKKKYIICYDVSNYKKRVKLAKLLLKYGIRTQKSFFEGYIEENLIENIAKESIAIIDENTDKVYFIPVDNKNEKKIMRYGKLADYYAAPDIFI
jgi:CRISPR-associated protein Cas2